MKKRVLIFFIAVCLVLSVFTVISCNDKKQNIICDDATFEYDGAGKRIFAVNDINKDFLTGTSETDSITILSGRPQSQESIKLLLQKKGITIKRYILR